MIQITGYRTGMPRFDLIVSDSFGYEAKRLGEELKAHMKLFDMKFTKCERLLVFVDRTDEVGDIYNAMLEKGVIAKGEKR